jgi:hypothetical protein
MDFNTQNPNSLQNRVANISSMYKVSLNELGTASDSTFSNTHRYRDDQTNEQSITELIEKTQILVG